MFASTDNAIKCFQCNSDQNPRCTDLTDTGIQATVSYYYYYPPRGYLISSTGFQFHRNALPINCTLHWTMRSRLLVSNLSSCPKRLKWLVRNWSSRIVSDESSLMMISHIQFCFIVINGNFWHFQTALWRLNVVANSSNCRSHHVKQPDLHRAPRRKSHSVELATVMLATVPVTTISMHRSFLPHLPSLPSNCWPKMLPLSIRNMIIKQWRILGSFIDIYAERNIFSYLLLLRFLEKFLATIMLIWFVPLTLSFYFLFKFHIFLQHSYKSSVIIALRRIVHILIFILFVFFFSFSNFVPLGTISGASGY